MKFNKDNLIALMGDVAVQLGVPEDKREAAGVQCFNSMAISFDKIARSENKERNAVGLSVYPLLPPEDGLIKSLEGLDERILAMTLKNNIRPYVPLYQEVPMHAPHHQSQRQETDMPKNNESPVNDYSADPRYQAQIEGLQKMTAALNATFPEYQEPSEAENNRRISEKEERKAADWAKMQTKENTMDKEEDKYIVTPEKDSVIVTRLRDGATLFMQGDDADYFLREVDTIKDTAIRNHAIAQYDDVFEKMDTRVASVPTKFQLSENKIRDILANASEEFNPANTGYYESVEELVEKVRGSKNWSQGEVFVYAESEDKYVVMKQIAPSSCEMLTITQDGYKDVLTAYRFEQDELVAMVKGFMGDGPSLEDVSLRAAQEIGKHKELVIQADPAMGNKYEGKILGVTDQHVVVSLGRSALIVNKRDVDRVPAVEDNVKLAFAGGKGVFEVVKGVGVER